MNKSFFALILLTAFCGFFSKCKLPFSSEPSSCCGEADHGESVIFIDGNSIISEHGFQKKIDQVCMAQPNIRQILSQLPAEQQVAFYGQLADAVLAEELVRRFVNDKGLTNTDEYRQTAAEAHALVETQLLNNIFQSALLREIQEGLTDEQAEQFYLANRETMGIFKRAPFIEKAGGVVLSIVEGLSERQAIEMVQQSRSADLQTLARGLQKKVKDLGLVNSRSAHVDEAIRAKALTLASAPVVEMVKMSNGKYAVIKAREIHKDLYAAYQNPEVQEGVKNFMIRNELGKAMQKTLEELKQKYKTDVRREVLNKFVQVQAQPTPIESQEEPRVQATQAA